MTREFEITTTKTYKTVDGARKAVEKAGFEDLRHFMMLTAEGRFFPVFVGEVAVQRGVHYRFNIVG